MAPTYFGLFSWFLINFDIIHLMNLENYPKYQYISETMFSPDYGLYNQKYVHQIYEHKTHCDINLILSQSFIDRFDNVYEAQKFVQIAIQYVNVVYERQFSWKKNYPMIVYKIKSIQPLALDDTLNKYMNDPEELLKMFNEMVLSKKHRYCQQILLTGEDWNDILGVAYQDSIFSPKGNLCDAPSSFVITSLMKRKFINHATLAYLFAHEAAHTLCADHDLYSEANGSKSKQLTTIGSNPYNISYISQGSVVKYFIMDSGTGMIQEYSLPQFSRSSVNVIAQCLFIKGLQCFKKSNRAICGNGIVEIGEECDSNDHCCHPPGSTNECQFISGSVCTSNQPCCTSSCQFKDPTFLCRKMNECSYDSYCSGSDALCKIDYSSINNLTECDEGRALCHLGECKKSICSKYGKRPCHPTGDDACMIKCYNPRNRRCETAINKNSSKSLFLPNGWRCGSLFQGSCHNGLCREANLHSLNNYDISSKYVSIFSIIMIIAAILGISIGGYTIYRVSKKINQKIYPKS